MANLWSMKIPPSLPSSLPKTVVGEEPERSKLRGSMSDFSEDKNNFLSGDKSKNEADQSGGGKRKAQKSPSKTPPPVGGEVDEKLLKKSALNVGKFQSAPRWEERRLRRLLC